MTRQRIEFCNSISGTFTCSDTYKGSLSKILLGVLVCCWMLGLLRGVDWGLWAACVIYSPLQASMVNLYSNLF